MIVRIQNDEPMWVRYTMSVRIPDDTPEDEIHDAAMEKIYADDGVEIESGPEVETEIAGMDQEYTIIEVLPY
jgi:hypothetical protein